MVSNKKIKVEGWAGANNGTLDSLAADSTKGASDPLLAIGLAEADSLRNWIVNLHQQGTYNVSPTFSPLNDSIYLHPGLNKLTAGAYVSKKFVFLGTDSSEYIVYINGHLTIDTAALFAEGNINIKNVVWYVNGILSVSNTGLIGQYLSDSAWYGDNIGGEYAFWSKDGLAVQNNTQQERLRYSPNKIMNFSAPNRRNQQISTYYGFCGTFSNGLQSNLIRNGNFEDFSGTLSGRITFGPGPLDRNKQHIACHWNQFDQYNTPDLFHNLSTSRTTTNGPCDQYPQSVDIPKNIFGLTNSTSYNNYQGSSVKSCLRLVINEGSRESVFQELASPLIAGNYLVGFSASGVNECPTSWRNSYDPLRCYNDYREINLVISDRIPVLTPYPFVSHEYLYYNLLE
jgi:hypothetical protein